MRDPELLVSDEPDTLSMPGWVESSRDSLSGSAARDAIRARLFPALAQADGRAEPPRIGRFTILRTLGRGGMGVVYAAYDQRLDRKVALKLVRSKLAQRGDALLAHEAQGLAKLSHPNVVTVHEVGDHEGALFIAMEFVPGVTLRRWLETPRGWRTVLATLVAAGRGLEAAHAAGLVHRDFKPDNVLVGEDGRPRVLDSGLARGIDLVDEAEQLPSTIDDASLESSRTPLPRRLAGTPAYMAPELFVGESAGPAADQWAFCVVAFEALFGLRPFAGATLSELATAVAAAPPAKPSRSGEVPAAVHEVVLRGLTKQPNQRWASMTELLAALEAASERRSKLVRWTGAAVLGGGLALLGAALAREPEPELCPEDPAVLDGTWDAQRKAALERRYHDSGLSYANAATTVVVERLDRWAQGWIDGRRAACVATRIDGTQSDAMLDARMACFDRQRAEVEGLLGLMLERPSEAVVPESAALLDEVPELSACQGALEPAALPEDPDTREAIQAGYERLERATGLRILGALDEAEAEFGALAVDPTVQAHVPLELSLRIREADLETARRRFSTSLAQLHAAALDARELGLDDLEAAALVRAATVVADAGSPPLASWVIEDAEQVVITHGGADDYRLARIWWAQGRLAERNGELDQAKGSYQRALEHMRDHQPLLGKERLLVDLGNVEASRGELDRAEQLYLEARAQEHSRWGPQSRSAAHIEELLGGLALRRGDLDQAQTRYDTAAKLFAAEGPMSLGLATLADGRSKLAFMRGDLDGARGIVEQGLKIFESNGELGNERACNLALALGVMRYYSGDIEGSIGAYERALELIREVHGDRHSLVGLTHVNIGDSLLALGEFDRARAQYLAGLALLEPAVAHDDPGLALPLVGLGLCDLEQNQPTLALRRLERALALIDGVGEPQELAKLQLALARALAASDGDLERARSLADAAAQTYARLGLDELQSVAAAWRP